MILLYIKYLCFMVLRVIYCSIIHYTHGWYIFEVGSVNLA